MASKKYALVARYYEHHVWTLGMVRNAVAKGWITPEEFEALTGLPYETDKGEE